MHQTLLDLKTVTPMFLRGSDNEQLELRPPPFKALFRYWWRAAQGFTRARNLRDAESDQFGSTDGKSPFSIRIPGTIRPEETPYRLLPHHPNMDPVPAYEKEQPFCLELITTDAAAATPYEQIAKLSFLLGGVGTRSRRGFGSIRDTNWNFADVNDLRNEILNTLNGVAGAVRFQINTHIINGTTVQIIESTVAHFPNYPVIWRIYFGGPVNDVDSLLENIGWATHNHSHQALGDINPRMASPIHVRIQKVGNQFVPIVTQLNSVFPSTLVPHSHVPEQQNFINAVMTSTQL